jgi:hypothetical protein
VQLLLWVVVIDVFIVMGMVILMIMQAKGNEVSINEVWVLS